MPVKSPADFEASIACTLSLPVNPDVKADMKVPKTRPIISTIPNIMNPRIAKNIVHFRIELR